MTHGPKTQLHSAAQLGSTERTLALLSTGSQIDQGGPEGLTPLMYATLCGHSRIVRILLNKGANPSARTDSGVTALIMAAEHGYVAVAKLLVKAGADLEWSLAPHGEDGFTALHLAAKEGHSEVMSVLIKAGGNVNSRRWSGYTAMYMAAQKGNTDAVKMLLGAKADPLLSGKGETSQQTTVPLDAAAVGGYVEVVRELIRQVGIEGCGGASGGADALEMAAEMQHIAVMAVLMDAGVLDPTGAALRTASRGGREASVKFLLQQHLEKASCMRAYVNSRDDHGQTALWCVLRFVRTSGLPSPRVVRLLVDAGADALSPVRLTEADGRVLLSRTPLALTTMKLQEKNGMDCNGEDVTEDQLHGLEGIRRVLSRVEAIHAVSWLWQSDTSSIVRAAGGAGTTTATSAPLARVLLLLRRRASRRRVLLATLFRHSQKKY